MLLAAASDSRVRADLVRVRPGCVPALDLCPADSGPSADSSAARLGVLSEELARLLGTRSGGPDAERLIADAATPHTLLEIHLPTFSDSTRAWLVVERLHNPAAAGNGEREMYRSAERVELEHRDGAWRVARRTLLVTQTILLGPKP